MLRIMNCTTLSGEVQELVLPGDDHRVGHLPDQVIDAQGLTILPGLIDPHVHFRTPGLEHKEDWYTGAWAAICGGYTTVCDMPNTMPPTTDLAAVQAKHELIKQQLSSAGLPLKYQLYYGITADNIDQIPLIKDLCIGIKIFMACSTGNMLLPDEYLAQAFALAAANKLVVAVHAEDEARIVARQQQYQGSHNYHDHSQIRDVESACLAVAKAIKLARDTGAVLYILHVSSAAELDLIRAAKKSGLAVYAEVTPQHLWLNTSYYDALGGLAIVNPPLRSPSDNEALWAGINDGTIDTIGSDHAPHTLEEKQRPYPLCAAGMPGIETTLALLLNAYNNGLLSLERIVALTSSTAQDLFKLPANDDLVLVDLAKVATVMPYGLRTKCGWSPFAGQVLRGWPVYTIIEGRCFYVA